MVKYNFRDCDSLLVFTQHRMKLLVYASVPIESLVTHIMIK